MLRITFAHARAQTAGERSPKNLFTFLSPVHFYSVTEKIVAKFYLSSHVSGFRYSSQIRMTASIHSTVFLLSSLCIIEIKLRPPGAQHLKTGGGGRTQQTFLECLVTCSQHLPPNLCHIFELLLLRYYLLVHINSNLNNITVKVLRV